MNIKDAKEQIKNAITAYLTKDEFGNSVIPIERQRPLFLMGPPGIGKTAVVEQVAHEMGVGLLSYSMTHHTRQSALGLPFIEQKKYKGEEYSISEYTMSEIIASVYDMMETTGVEEGILFLDEINCVSETLAPVMLQFLQYKVFGRHKVPEGWIVVTAGNPPEYNNSVREFDIVTWDRLKRLDCEADYDVWKEYAYKYNVHPAIMTYLDIRKADFYRVESTVDGKSFVTARGWDDLSQMIKLYEKNEITVDEKLIAQYLQNATVAKEFAVYYDLFNKYKSDYQIEEILLGKCKQEIKDRAKNAKFDERLSLIGLLLDGVNSDLQNVVEKDSMHQELVKILKTLMMDLKKQKKDSIQLYKEKIQNIQQDIKNGKKSGTMSTAAERINRLIIAFLESLIAKTQDDEQSKDSVSLLKSEFDASVKGLKKLGEAAKKKLSFMFGFIEEVFEDGQEMLIVVTELTANYYSAKFISSYGCPEYFKHNSSLLFYERHKEIERVIEEMKLD